MGEKKDWIEQNDIAIDTEPNYMALLYTILHGGSVDNNLREFGIYSRQRASFKRDIDSNDYLDDEEKVKIKLKRSTKGLTKRKKKGILGGE